MELKQQIKERYGSLKRLCERNDICYSHISHKLSKKDQRTIDKLTKIIEEDDQIDYVDENAFKEEDRYKIISVIDIHYDGNVAKFCRANPGIKYEILHWILNGDLKKKTNAMKMVLDICDTYNIEAQ